MKQNSLKNFNIQKIVFLIVIAVLFFYGLESFARPKCKDLPSPGDGLKTYKKENCELDFIFTDPPGGSGLDKCYYQVISNGVITTSPEWIEINGSCTGSGPVTIPTEITIGAGQNCRDNGYETCAVYALAIDGAGNSNGASVTLNINYKLSVVINISPNPINQNEAK